MASALRQRLLRAVIYEDNHLVALNKWRGLAVQDAAGSPSTVLSNVDVFQQNKDGFVPRLAHRLDQNTTGVLVLAKTAEAVLRLNRLFQLGAVAKTYEAVLAGQVTKPTGTLKGIPELITEEEDANSELTSNQPLFKTSASWSHSTAQSHYTVLASAQVNDGRPSRTKPWLTRVELRPTTGYKHQLRIQCADGLRAPVLGDKRYGGGQEQVSPIILQHLQRHGLRTAAHPYGLVMHLHAKQLVIPGYNWDGSDLVLRATLPDHMQLTIDACGLHPDQQSRPTRQPTRQTA
ncbi:uncharacterized protein MONBRDRAFT_26051 [Monosiga brevicollis MX1]|uniref:Pseudouridylate synthase RPUSD4, mitochondrial n=1 Tax=Monosiga brevicollis TaxID=81824 RepID=A9V182_MONBE|nr:uncharacterized protein MONBRDRAFT_26051 [Monosiga brevicollis MX1]EDQ88763.1 predicted protein [Monosiga brevicollis MX1]|eukprot:XP_001746376.1 hypothetical protein [Monosiga brevicollis MX1]